MCISYLHKSSEVGRLRQILTKTIRLPHISPKVGMAFIEGVIAVQIGAILAQVYDARSRHSSALAPSSYSDIV